MEIQPIASSSSPQPFDGVARSYDQDFTCTPLGIRKRNLVYHYVEDLLRPDWKVLELNCGTGEDALWLSGRTAEVVATDISGEMVKVAEEKCRSGGRTNVTFHQMGIQQLWQREGMLPFDTSKQFDLIFSNFDGLNCLPDLSPLPSAFRNLLTPEGQAILVLMSRFCALETFGYLVRGEPGRAFERGREEGKEIHIGMGMSARTWFHPIGELVQLFRGEGFRVEAIRAIGLLTPPTSMRDFYHRHLSSFRKFERLEERLSPYYPFNRMGDHVLIHVKV